MKILWARRLAGVLPENKRLLAQDDSDNDANSGSDFESGEESADPISEEESDFSYDSDVQIVNPPSKRRKVMQLPCTSPEICVGLRCTEGEFELRAR